MKKFGVFLAAALVGFLLGSYAFAIEWHTMYQATITWEASPGLEDNWELPATESLEYAVWLAAEADKDKTNAKEVGITSDLIYTVTKQDEGKSFVGVQTLRKLADGSITSKSNIAWSDNPEAVFEGTTFGLVYWHVPMMVQGLKLLNK